MRTRNNKAINFILEFSQVLFLFLGVYSALMCAAFGLELSFNRGLCTLIMLLAAILFYGLFTVLETFPKGKLYGLLGITAFYAVLVFRFRSVLKKGIVTIANSFLKEFMNYTGSNLALFPYKDTESVSVMFCTTFVLILTGVYLIAVISAFFYRKRRASVFLALTLPLVLVPLFAGRMGYFSNLFTYLVILVAVVGTRHLRTDATDRRMRQKLSFILVLAGLVAGVLSYLIMPPAKYERNGTNIMEMRNTVVALSSWTMDDIFAWVKSNFNEDAMDYGTIGDKNEVVYSGETLLKISGDVYTEKGIYLKGYVGDLYADNHWSSLSGDPSYEQDLKALEDSAVTLENWHVQLRNELGENETSGVSGLWDQWVLRIRNVAFGYGNYLVPYLPTDSFEYGENGRVKIARPGIDYTIQYYPIYPIVQRRDVLHGDITLANHVFWESNEAERKRLEEFATKYYLQVPESLQGVCDDFAAYLKQSGLTPQKLKNSSSMQSRIIRAVKQYIMEDTEYTLAPGKTPAGRDTVEYFLTEGKKGYCVYYATAAAILLRSVGIPARYVEGMYVPKEELAKGVGDGSEVSVPDRCAHAWVEVYQNQYGFVPVEVTPGHGEFSEEIEDPEESFSDGEPEAGNDDKKGEKDEPDSEPDEKPEAATPTPIVSEVPQEDMIFEDIEREEGAVSGGAATGENGGGDSSRLLWKILEGVGTVILIFAAIEAQRRIRRYIFGRNLKRLRMKKRIRMVHHHLAVLLAQRGVVYRGQTMSRYTREISQAMEMPYDKIYDYVTLVFRARFGPDDITEEDMAVFRITYENIRRKAYENAKPLKKLYYMYIMVL